MIKPSLVIYTSLELMLVPAAPFMTQRMWSVGYPNNPNVRILDDISFMFIYPWNLSLYLLKKELKLD